MKIQAAKKQIIEAFRECTQKFTKDYQRWNSEKGKMIGEPYPAPIPFGKFQIDEDFGKKEICIRCRKCWTDDLIKVAQQICKKFGCKYSSPLSVGSFGTAYNFFTIKIT